MSKGVCRYEQPLAVWEMKTWGGQVVHTLRGKCLHLVDKPSTLCRQTVYTLRARCLGIDCVSAEKGGQGLSRTRRIGRVVLGGGRRVERLCPQ